MSSATWDSERTQGNGIELHQGRVGWGQGKGTAPSCQSSGSAGTSLSTIGFRWSHVEPGVGFSDLYFPPPTQDILCWFTTCMDSSVPSMGAHWDLTLVLSLLTDRATVSRPALARALISHQDRFSIVLARPTATGIEFQQVLIQSPLQVLPFGFHVASITSAQDFVDRLQLHRVEIKNGGWGFQLGTKLRCCREQGDCWVKARLRKSSFVFLDSCMDVMQTLPPLIVPSEKPLVQNSSHLRGLCGNGFF